VTVNVQVNLLVEQIDQSILIAIITVIGTLGATVLSLGIPYLLTKNKEIDESSRQKRTERYEELTVSLAKVGSSDIYGDVSLSLMNDFIMAYYKASAYADDSVIKACNRFLKSIGDNESEAEITQRITDIYTCIRQDINPNASPVQSIAFWKTSEIKES
jgi:hypothetical protein